MKVVKDGIIKDVEKRIMPDYFSAGWKAYQEPTLNNEKNDFKISKHDKNYNK